MKPWRALVLAASVLVCCVLPLFSAGAVDIFETLQHHDPTTDQQPQQGTTPQAVTVTPGTQNTSGTSAASGLASSSAAPARATYGLAIMSDLHISKDNQDSVLKAVNTVNSMPGLNAVAILGDIVEKIGSPAEYDRAKNVVAKFSPPVLAITGNHDVIYQDALDKKGNKKRSTAKQRKAKFERFQQAFGQKELRFYRKVGGHLLVFLPADALSGKPLVGLSGTTLDFFQKTLRANRDLPTIVFCHAPLSGSYAKRGALAPIHADAQPAGTIRSILRTNPQVFLWVSGHRHVKPSSTDFNAPVNKVDNVTVINVPNVPNMKNAKSWIMTMRLTDDAATIRTYDVEKKAYIKKHDRVFHHSGSNKNTSTATTKDKNKVSDASTGTDKSDDTSIYQKVLASLQKTLDVLKKYLQQLMQNKR